MTEEPKKVDQNVELLKAILEDAEKGNLMGLALVAILKDGRARFITAMGETHPIHIVGAIDVLKSQALSRVKLED